MARATLALVALCVVAAAVPQAPNVFEHTWEDGHAWTWTEYVPEVSTPAVPEGKVSAASVELLELQQAATARDNMDQMTEQQKTEYEAILADMSYQVGDQNTGTNYQEKVGR
jgi:hypothetical protein